MPSSLRPASSLSGQRWPDAGDAFLPYDRQCLVGREEVPFINQHPQDHSARRYLAIGGSGLPRLKPSCFTRNSALNVKAERMCAWSWEARKPVACPTTPACCRGVPWLANAKSPQRNGGVMSSSEDRQSVVLRLVWRRLRDRSRCQHGGVIDRLGAQNVDQFLQVFGQ